MIPCCAPLSASWHLILFLLPWSETVLIYLGCFNKYYSQNGLFNRNLFSHSSGGLKSVVPVWLGSGGSVLSSWLADNHLPNVSKWWKERRKLAGVWFVRCWLLVKAHSPALSTPSRPPPQAPPPNSIHKAGTSVHESEGRNIQSTSSNLATHELGSHNLFESQFCHLKYWEIY